MMNWTNEAVRAEADYRRQALHRMASHRRADGNGRSALQRWLSRGHRAGPDGS